MESNEGNTEGNTTGGVTGAAEGLWREQLPADLKGNETFTSYKTLGDFGKAHIETVGKVKELEGKVATIADLEGKLSGAIVKPGENATPEQIDAYHKSIGKPEKPTDYNFPVLEGMERDPKFTEWAQNTFHQIGIPKEMGEKVAAAYDAFGAALVKAQNEAHQKENQEAEAKVKAELGDQYPVALELCKRMLADHATPEEKAFLEKSDIGNNPILARILFKFAKKTGEDVGLQGGNSNRADLKPGIVYDKSPKPPQI
jgi:hypothetical protein